MLFSSDKKSDSSQEGQEKKKDSLFGLLFNPNRGTEVQPVLDSLRMFPRMVALVFAVAGLFPKDHPALTDEKLRLSWRSVIGTAWGNVRFTREGLPGALTFAAVISMLAMVVTFLVSLVLSLFMGTAHAAGSTNGMFDSPASKDVASSFINHLFLGEAMSLFEGGGSADCSLVSALSTALGFFSSAVLVFAGIMLLYHLVSMIAKTAQSGKPFEGANQVWGPIRLVFAIALLVPISSSGTTSGGGCSVTGYNAGQYLVLKIAKWGSGLGSNGWDYFLSSWSKASNDVSCDKPSDSPSCAVQQNVKSLVRDLILYDACAKFADHYLEEQQLSFMSGYDVTDIATAIHTGDNLFGYTVKGVAAVSWTATEHGRAQEQSFCGGYTIPERPEYNVYVKVYDKILARFKSLTTSIDGFNQSYYLFGTDGANIKKEKYDEMKVEYEDLLSNFQKDVKAAIEAGIQESQGNAEKVIKNDFESIREYGWLYAGTWFNTIARVQAQKFSVMADSLPKANEPWMLNSSADIIKMSTIKGLTSSIQEATFTYQHILDKMGVQIKNEAAASLVGSMTAEEKSLALAGSGKLKDQLQGIFMSLNPVEGLLGIVEGMAVSAGLFNEEGGLGIKFGFSQDPFEELSSYGQKALFLGDKALVTAAVAELVAVVPVIKLAPIAGFAATILSMIAITLYAIGFSIAFMVPLFPFYRFFFGALKWVLSVCEAVVLMPLLSLAHIHPGGDGLAGPQGKYGYTVAMQIILRPVLMIFGLVVGFMMFKVSLALLNEMFTIAAVGTGALTGPVSVMAKIVYTVIYAALVIMLANQSFKTIGLFPLVALSWIGLQKPHEETIGDPGAINLAGGAVANLMMKDNVPKIFTQATAAGKKWSDQRQAAVADANAANARAKDLQFQKDLLDKI
ncbi:MAG: DotA/TraY family protein [Bdellovibrionales bacterium]